jgi:serine/threonine protein kinase
MLAVAQVSTLDRYELVELIGHGGMAEVFRARVQSLGGFEREVAVKVLLPQYAGEPEFVDMLLDEARIAGAIVHPCVVQMLDVGRCHDIFYLVMELVRGTDLRSLARLADGGRLPLGLSLYAIGEVLRGLSAVHGAVDGAGRPRRIIHRDVSPANVLIDDAGAVKLGDFGIAHASGRLTRTRVGSVKGKSRYMAPEQLSGQPVDHRADLYAVGVTLFEALLGDLARESSEATPLGPVFTWPRHLPPNALPADVAALIRRAVSDTPAQRFADASSFRHAVVAALTRHAPGYDGESLARELKRLRGELDDLDDAGETAEATELRSTRPRLVVLSSPPRRASPPPLPQKLAPAKPYARRDAGAPSDRHAPSVRHSVAGAAAEGCASLVDEPPLTQPFSRATGAQIVVAISALGLTALISLVVALFSARSPPPPAPALVAAPVVRTSSLPASPTTGTLAIAGPVGARVTIGSVAYPPAPCSVELPPGEYDVKLRVRGRALVRHVSINPGEMTQL